MSETLVSVEHVSKKFCRTLKRALWYGVKDLTSELVGRKGERTNLRSNEFWALRDVSFEVKRGEVVGLIGPNGAGKTTTLRLLNGLIKPDQGHIMMQGRVGALIELGAGFNPILTGRENVFVSAAMLGIPRKEVTAKLDEIIDFSGVREFIDMPVQSYSSGMRVRLGFSVAVNMRPDIILVDEVLAVGDISFRNKCMEAIHQIRNSGVGFVFVSHNPGAVQLLCDRVIYLRSGQIVAEGSPAATISRYVVDSQDVPMNGSADYIHQPGTEEYLRVVDFRFLDQDGNAVEGIKSGDSLNMRMEFEAFQQLRSPWFHFTVHPGGQQDIAATINRPLDDARPSFSPGRHSITVAIPKCPLLQSTYSLSVTIHEGSDLIQRYGRVDNLGQLKIHNRDNQMQVRDVYVEVAGHWSSDGV